MNRNNSVVAVYPSHTAAEAAIKELRLVSRICGWIPAPEAGLTCDKGLFP